MPAFVDRMRVLALLVALPDALADRGALPGDAANGVAR
jgi:hypothetical protein